MNIRQIEEIVDQELRPAPEFSTPSSLIVDASWLTLRIHTK
ncbi:MAG: hypothetical protein RL475_639 [Actinomycetota bacterium]|jgi:hypothetical protein